MLFGRAVIIVGAIGMALICCGQEEPSAAEKKEAAIRKLLEVTGAGKLGTQVMEQMGTAFGGQMDADFGEFWNDFVSRVKVDEMVNLIVPIYARHFETAEIEELIRFNQTPVGQKFNREMPAIMQESIAAGMEWGQSLAKSAMEKYEARKGK